MVRQAHHERNLGSRRTESRPTTNGLAVHHERTLGSRHGRADFRLNTNGLSAEHERTFGSRRSGLSGTTSGH